MLSVQKISNGLRELRRAYEDEEEVAPSRKRKSTAPADGDTREVKRRGTAASSSSSSSHDYCESPPAAQEIPWGPLYQDVSDDDDDEFTFSPASPPLTQMTEEDEKTAPPTLYVFPDATVLLTSDGGCVRIPDQPATQPEPSTMEAQEDDENDDEDEPAASQAHASNMNTKVCIIIMEEAISHIITNQWRKSAPSTLEEVTTDVCQSLTATILSAVFHELMMAYARINIRRQP